MPLTADRDTPRAIGATKSSGVSADAIIFKGALVVLNGGFAEPGSVATTLVAIGRAEESVDNTGGQDGDKTVRTRAGVFRFANSSAGDAITAADIGSDCYIVDDFTVAKTDGTATRSVAGKVMEVDSLGVWVAIGPGGIINGD